MRAPGSARRAFFCACVSAWGRLSAPLPSADAEAEAEAEAADPPPLPADATCCVTGVIGLTAALHSLSAAADMPVCDCSCEASFECEAVQERPSAAAEAAEGGWKREREAVSSRGCNTKKRRANTRVRYVHTHPLPLSWRAAASLPRRVGQVRRRQGDGQRSEQSRAEQSRAARGQMSEEENSRRQ